MTEFERWNKAFQTQNLFDFNGNANGILWLKTRAVRRNELMDKFLKENNITLTEKGINARFQELYNLLLKHPEQSNIRLDAFLSDPNNEWYDMQQVDEKQLKQDLYLIDSYTWGGDQNNSLDKYLVRYVKSTSTFAGLENKKADIESNAWNYVQVSWYNNWTSYLIELLFKRHPRVVSAVGEIKSVDFFINDFPIDLKVTFFPKKYMQPKLKEKLGWTEITWLKRQAKACGIPFDSEMDEGQLKGMILEKLYMAQETAILKQYVDAQTQVVNEAISNPNELVSWLYSQQGEMRFGAENRLFLILVDRNNISESWKLKRAFDQIEPIVQDYLDRFTADTLKPVAFNYQGNAYQALADVIFVTV